MLTLEEAFFRLYAVFWTGMSSENVYKMLKEEYGIPKKDFHEVFSYLYRHFTFQGKSLDHMMAEIYLTIEARQIPLLLFEREKHYTHQRASMYWDTYLKGIWYDDAAIVARYHAKAAADTCRGKQDTSPASVTSGPCLGEPSTGA